jgi:predicted GTPase
MSIRNPSSIIKISFPDSIEIDNSVTRIKAEPSMNSTLRGITIDRSDEYENASDSIRAKCEFDSNVIDESDLQYEKQFDPRISTFLGIKID